MPHKENRPSARQRGYSPRWDRYRARYLHEHPWCASCALQGRKTRATVVDHKVPHKGDHRLFWKPENHQPLCKTCHNGPKQSEERTGRARGCDADGMPLDRDHHWHMRRRA
jgi:5-methylcytosine-specific restriction protein A